MKHVSLKLHPLRENVKKYLISARCATFLGAFSAVASELPPVATETHGITTQMQEEIEHYRLIPPENEQAPVANTEASSSPPVEIPPQAPKKVEPKQEPSEKVKNEKAVVPEQTKQKTPASPEAKKEDIPVAERYLNDLKLSTKENDRYVLDLDYAFDTLTSQYRSMEPKERKKYLKAAEKELKKLGRASPDRDDLENVRKHIALIAQYQLLKTLSRETDLSKQKNLPMGRLRNNYTKNVKEEIDKLYESKD